MGKIEFLLIIAAMIVLAVILTTAFDAQRAEMGGGFTIWVNGESYECAGVHVDGAHVTLTGCTSYAYERITLIGGQDWQTIEIEINR
jgi:hypothetical protein